MLDATKVLKASNDSMYSTEHILATVLGSEGN